MKRKIEERLKAIALRKKGYSVNEIVKKLCVAKGSVSVWVRNAPLDKKAERRLLTKIKLGQWKAAENKKERTRKEVERFGHDAQKIIRKAKLTDNLQKILCGVMYWCEGAKDAKSGMRFTNSDPNVIKTFLALVRKTFSIDEDRLRIGLYLHEYHDINKQIKFWASVTDIPPSRFIKPFLKPHTARRIRENYPGCATVYYYKNSMARELFAIGKEFFKQGGIV